MPTQADLALQALGPQAAGGPSVNVTSMDFAPNNTPIPPEDRPQKLPPEPAQPTQADAALAALASSPAAPAPVGQPLGTGDSLLKGLNDITTAGGQMLAHALPQGAVDAVNNATSYVNNLPGIGPVTQALGMVPATVQQVDQNAQQGEAQYQANRQASVPQGQTPAIDWGRGAGDAIGALPLAGVGGTGALSAALQGGAASALTTPVTSGDYATEKGKQALVGALTGGGGNIALRGAASVISPAISPMVKTLLGSGVTPTLGQTLGGTANRLEQAATSIPVVGDMIKNAQRRAVEQLNTAAVNRALTPIGDSLPKGVSGREAISYAVGKLSAGYDSVLAKIGAVKPDETFLSNVANLQGLTGTMPKASADQFSRILDTEVLGRINKSGMMTGEGLKAAESNLGQLAKGYGRSADFDQRQLGTAIQQTQAELRTMLARVRPDVAPELAAINKGYANLMPSQRAASYVGADGGMFSASQLQSAVKANDPSKNKRAFATGNALMQDLSEAGKSVLGPTVPDSGTPYRHGVQVLGAALLGHGMLPEGAAHMAIPAAAGLGMAALPYTAAGQKMVSALLTKRPVGADRLAALLQGAAPYAALAAPAVAAGSK